MEFQPFFRAKPQNLANWPAEFNKIMLGEWGPSHHRTSTQWATDNKHQLCAASPAQIAQMRSFHIHVACSVVCVSVCWALGLAVQKRLNGLTFRLEGADSCGQEER